MATGRRCRHAWRRAAITDVDDKDHCNGDLKLAHRFRPGLLSPMLGSPIAAWTEGGNDRHLMASLPCAGRMAPLLVGRAPPAHRRSSR